MTDFKSTQTFQPIKVIDIDLSQPIETIENLDGYIALKAIVRLHGSPLGYIQLGVTNGYCTAAALGKAILEQHSWAIIRHLISDGLAEPLEKEALDITDLVSVSHPVYSGPFPLVTVVVCTRDRASDLAICLDALSQLDYPNLDILIVDNAPSNDDTEHLVRNNYPTFRYVREPRPGLSWARNRSIIEANGEIIAFTDDDVVVDPGWVSALAQVFAENPKVMAVTGLVVPYELETEAQILFEYHGGFGRGFERYFYQVDTGQHKKAADYLGTGRFGTGANMAYRRSLFEHIGNFDPALGVGTVTKGGEDIEMFFRLLHNGYTLVYEPNAMVRHRHRRDYASLRQQLTNNAIALTSYHVRSALAYPSLRLAFVKLQLWWLWHWHIKRLIQAFTRPHRFPRDLVLAEIRGYLMSLFPYFKTKRVVAKISQKFGPQVSASSIKAAHQTYNFNGYGNKVESQNLFINRQPG